MAHIRTIGETEAVGELAEVYGKLGGAAGRVPNILKAESLAPRALGAHFALYRELMLRDGPLSQTRRELMAVAVSQANACHY